MKDKIDYVYLPYLLTSILLTSSYTFLHWLFIIRYDFFKLNEDIVNIFIPLALCITVHFLLYRRRRKLIARVSEKSNFCDLIILTLLALPLVTAQFFLDDETGKLTQLSKISQITENKLSRFYKVDSIFIHKSRFYTSHHAYLAKKSRRNFWSKNFEMEKHFVVPLFNNPNDTAHKVPSAWLGKSYYQTVDDVNDSINKLNFDKFIKSSTLRLLNNDINEFEYLRRLYNSETYDTYLYAMGYSKNAIILKAEESKFSSRTGASLEFCVYGYIASAIAFLFVLALCDLDEERLKLFKKE